MSENSAWHETPEHGSGLLLLLLLFGKHLRALAMARVGKLSDSTAGQPAAASEQYQRCPADLRSPSKPGVGSAH